MIKRRLGYIRHWYGKSKLDFHLIMSDTLKYYTCCKANMQVVSYTIVEERVGIEK
jgi:hypothetical protein